MLYDLVVTAVAQFSLANLYYYGSGIEKDLSQAFLWYQKSSSQGQPYAAYSSYVCPVFSWFTAFVIRTLYYKMV